MFSLEMMISVCSAGVLFALTGCLLYLKTVLKRRFVCGCCTQCKNIPGPTGKAGPQNRKS